VYHIFPFTEKADANPEDVTNSHSEKPADPSVEDVNDIYVTAPSIMPDF
jgi:hypothetical protein